MRLLRQNTKKKKKKKKKLWEIISEDVQLFVAISWDNRGWNPISLKGLLYDVIKPKFGIFIFFEFDPVVVIFIVWIISGNIWTHTHTHIVGNRGLPWFMFFVFWLRILPEYYFLAQAFANLHGKRRQGKFIWKTRIYMLQTCKHDTAKSIFLKKVLIF